ncbi:MAG: cation transporter [Nanoarchaeota archaeon]
METRIYVPDISCESCVRLIRKRFNGAKGVHSLNFGDQEVTIGFDEALTQPERLTAVIKGLGYRASLDPIEHKTLKEQMRDFKENTEKYRIETKAIRYAVYGFIILSLLETIAYFGILKTIPGFFLNYSWWLFYLNISIVALGTAVFHVLSYRAKITHMVGMMIGMTFGMQAGMMLGVIIGATNGFFIGSLAGMLIGVGIGALMGKCCGIMGVMEGMMAGLMGGMMGPMISVMMFNDHLLWFMPFFMVINVLILGGLSYMFIQHVQGQKELTRRSTDFMTFASLSIIATAVLIAIIAYGPRSVLLGG